MQYNNVTFSPRNLFLAAARERESQGFYGIGEEDSSSRRRRRRHAGRRRHGIAMAEELSTFTGILTQMLQQHCTNNSFACSLLFLFLLSPRFAVASSLFSNYSFCLQFLSFFAAYYNIWYLCAPQIDRSSMPHTLLLFLKGLYCSCGCLLTENNFKKIGIRQEAGVKKKYQKVSLNLKDRFQKGASIGDGRSGKRFNKLSTKEQEPLLLL